MGTEWELGNRLLHPSFTLEAGRTKGSQSMLVLIATHEFQGAAPGDYSHTVDGELVTAVVTECGSSDRCGCNRGFPGLASAKATTTAMIVDRPGVTEEDLRDAIYDWLDRGGWIDLIEQGADERNDLDDDPFEYPDSRIEDMIDEHLEMINDVCASFQLGTVLSRRGPLISSRSMPAAA